MRSKWTFGRLFLVVIVAVSSLSFSWVTSFPSKASTMAELLTKLAGDDNAMVRARVAAALARLADNNPALAAELLTRLAGDDDVEVRATAAYALADLAPDHPALAAELLTRLAGDDDAEIQATAAYALADLVSDNPALAAEGLANSSDDWLLANLGAKGYKLRTAAVAELGRREVSRTPAVVQRLLVMLNDSDNDVRKAVRSPAGSCAARSVSHSSSSKSVPPLCWQRSVSK